MYNVNAEPQVRVNVKESLIRYAQEGVPTGGFLYAVLTNNLVEACKRVDRENQPYLFNIVSFCYNELPMGCWGTEEKVRTHLRTMHAEHERAMLLASRPYELAFVEQYLDNDDTLQRADMLVLGPFSIERRTGLPNHMMWEVMYHTGHYGLFQYLPDAVWSIFNHIADSPAEGDTSSLCLLDLKRPGD